MKSHRHGLHWAPNWNYVVCLDGDTDWFVSFIFLCGLALCFLD